MIMDFYGFLTLEASDINLDLHMLSSGHYIEKIHDSLMMPDDAWCHIMITPTEVSLILLLMYTNVANSMVTTICNFWGSASLKLKVLNWPQ